MRTLGDGTGRTFKDQDRAHKPDLIFPSDFSKTTVRGKNSLLWTRGTPMNRAAIGIRMHSGWGVLVAVSDQLGVIDRRRITVTTDSGPRGNQPFHHAQDLGLPNAKKYLSDYRVESERMARKAIGAAADELKARGYAMVASAILLASGKPLPELPKIRASHPLIHTAEGELFREVVSRACESIGIPVMRYREQALEEIAKSVLAASTQSALKGLVTAGKKLGPPWTADHKAAALAACVALHQLTTKYAATGESAEHSGVQRMSRIILIGSHASDLAAGHFPVR